jgi:hypothetical protein
MSFLNNLFGSDEKTMFFQLENFESNYELLVNNEFIMGKDNPVISLSTVSNILLSQVVSKTNINSNIVTESIVGNTDSQTMKPHLQDALLLGAISKKINFSRNLNGKIIGITNRQTLHDEWHLWKKYTLPEMYSSKDEQEQFSLNYEKGLELLENSIHHNLNHFILLPDIYHIKNYISNAASNATSERVVQSKLIKGMIIRYKFVVTFVSIAEASQVRLKAEVLNTAEIKNNFLKKLYSAQSEFTLADYDFSIDVDYLLNANTGKIISGNLILKEKMHEKLQYILNIQAKEIGQKKSSNIEVDIKKPRRKFLGDGIID